MWRKTPRFALSCLCLGSHTIYREGKSQVWWIRVRKEGVREVASPLRKLPGVQDSGCAPVLGAVSHLALLFLLFFFVKTRLDVVDRGRSRHQRMVS